ncbi:MAG: class B sortase [Bacilli bacterium]|nr:class B sortase [Bacilli bacterium]
MKKKWIFILVGVILIAFVLVVRIYRPVYQVKDRTEKLEKFRSVEKQKAMAWIRVAGTNIDLPVMYYDIVEDISDPTYDIAWSYTNDKTLPDKSTVFSHNVLNVSSNPLIGDKNHRRFEQLMAYIYYDFAKDNQYIQYTINNKNYLFKIYGVSFVQTDEIESDSSNRTKEELKKYIQDVKKDSYFQYDTDVDSQDKLLSLVTCTRFFGSDTSYSFVVDARLLRKNERAGKSKVVEKDNYKKIRKIMEGEKEDA